MINLLIASFFSGFCAYSVHKQEFGWAAFWACQLLIQLANVPRRNAE